MTSTSWKRTPSDSRTAGGGDTLSSTTTPRPIRLRLRGPAPTAGSHAIREWLRRITSSLPMGGGEPEHRQRQLRAGPRKIERKVEAGERCLDTVGDREVGDEAA